MEPIKKDSPVERFPGSVYLVNPPTLPAVAIYEEAMTAGKLLSAEYMLEGKIKNLPQSRYYATILPGILALIDHFEVAGVPSHPTVEEFPYKPREAASLFVGWLVSVVRMHVEEDGTIPPA